MSIQPIKSAYERALKNERHEKVSETRYWCGQYRLMAEWAIDELERQAIADLKKQAFVAMQMDVIVGNLIREGINKHRARELAEHFIKHAQPKQDQGGPVACPLRLDTQDANQLCSAGYCDKCKQPSVAIPSVEFEKVADGIEIGYDFLGGVDIRLGGEFVYVHINYDYRYTHNAARKALAEQIVGLFTHPQPNQPLTDESKDAHRYRLLRRGQQWSVINGIGDVLRADALDAAIDAVAQHRGEHA